MKILFLGGGYTSHLMVIANAIKSIDNTIQLDFLSEKEAPADFKYEFPFPMDNIILIDRKFPNFLYRIPKLRSILRSYDYRKKLSIFKIGTYDYAHFEYIDPWNCKFVGSIKRICKATIATPWGSDVYRPTDRVKKMLPSFFNQVDVITAMNSVMREALINIYHVEKEKIVDLPVVGTTALDNIINSNIDKDSAKKALGLLDRFTIVCGTNASPAQRHDKILEELNKVKNKLPEETTLMFLLGRDDRYDNLVIKRIKESGFDFKIFQRRITDSEMLLWRKAADMLIHAQVSDSASGAIVEALLCGTTIVNASWLKYPNLERWGVPYYLFNSFEELPSVVLDAFKNEKAVRPSENLIKYIKSLTMKEEVGRIVSFYKSYNR